MANTEAAVSETDILASSSCNLDINTLVQMKKWKDNALIDFADSGGLEGM